MKRSLAVLLGLLLASITLVAAPAGAATRPYCGLTWGSLAKVVPANSVAPLTQVRAGRHACYDRVVLDVSGDVAGYTAHYVPQVVQDGSGLPIALRGGARIQLTANLPAYDELGNPTYSPANPAELVDVTGYRTLRQLAWAGSYEGYSSVGIGVRARLPFRVFTLDGPGSGARIVVDVAHRW